MGYNPNRLHLYVGEITYLLIIDPNFQQDILVVLLGVKYLSQRYDVKHGSKLEDDYRQKVRTINLVHVGKWVLVLVGSNVECQYFILTSIKTKNWVVNNSLYTPFMHVIYVPTFTSKMKHTVGRYTDPRNDVYILNNDLFVHQIIITNFQR